MTHIPLTLLYASLTKFFLLSLLSIWYSNVSPDAEPPLLSAENTSFAGVPLLERAYTVFDETTLDRDWVVRNMLGGLAAGFGLRGMLVELLRLKR